MPASLVAVILVVLSIATGVTAAVRRSRALGVLAAAMFVLGVVYAALLFVLLRFSHM
jgi:ABC-type microcin C transport system permease subunit YejB